MLAYECTVQIQNVYSFTKVIYVLACLSFLLYYLSCVTVYLRDRQLEQLKLFWPCLEMTCYQGFQSSFICHWGFNDTGPHYSDHPSHYVSPRPGIEPGLLVCQVSMLPTQPPGDVKWNKLNLCTNGARFLPKTSPRQPHYFLKMRRKVKQMLVDTAKYRVLWYRTFCKCQP